MQSEEEKIDLACLEAVRDMGGYVTLESWVYSLYLRDAVPTYDDFFESSCRLRKSKLIRNSILALNGNYSYCLTLRGKAAVRKKEIEYKESKSVKEFTLRESTFESAKKKALKKIKNTTDEVLKKQKRAAFLCVLLWLFSIAFLAGGIVFACLYRGSFDWRVGVGIAGFVLYAVIGTIDAFICVKKCGFRTQVSISLMCFPSYSLLGLILWAVSGG